MIPTRWPPRIECGAEKLIEVAKRVWSSERPKYDRYDTEWSTPLLLEFAKWLRQCPYADQLYIRRADLTWSKPTTSLAGLCALSVWKVVSCLAEYDAEVKRCRVGDRMAYTIITR